MWSKVNAELLRKIFDDDGEALKYEETFTFPVSPNQSQTELAKDLKREIADKISRLESVLERLDTFEVAEVSTEEKSVKEGLKETHNPQGIPAGKKEKKSFWSKLVGK